MPSWSCSQGRSSGGGSILACAAAGAFASSLLDRQGHRGADGTTLRSQTQALNGCRISRRVLKFFLISAGRHVLRGSS